MTTAETERVRDAAMCAMDGNAESSNIQLMRLRAHPRIKGPPTSASTDTVFQMPWPDHAAWTGGSLEEWM